MKFFEEIQAEFGDARFTVFQFPPVPKRSAEPSFPHTHSHQYYESHLVISGESVVRMNDRDITIQGGCALILPPGSEHYTLSYPEDARGASFDFLLEQIEGKTGFYRYFRNTLDTLTAAPEPIPLSAELMNDILLMNHFSDLSDIRDYCFVRQLLYHILYTLFWEIDRYGTQAPLSEKMNQEQSTLVLLDNLINTGVLSEKQIAERFGYSVKQTQRLIMKTYGCGFAELRQKRCLKTACHVMEDEPTLSLREIARRSGFSGYDVMTRAFLKNCGCTPLEYKRRILERVSDKPESEKQEKNN